MARRVEPIFFPSKYKSEVIFEKVALDGNSLNPILSANSSSLVTAAISVIVSFFKLLCNIKNQRLDYHHNQFELSPAQSFFFSVTTYNQGFHSRGEVFHFGLVPLVTFSIFFLPVIPLNCCCWIKF